MGTEHQVGRFVLVRCPGKIYGPFPDSPELGFGKLIGQLSQDRLDALVRLRRCRRVAPRDAEMVGRNLERLEHPYEAAILPKGVRVQLILTGEIFARYVYVPVLVGGSHMGRVLLVSRVFVEYFARNAVVPDFVHHELNARVNADRLCEVNSDAHGVTSAARCGRRVTTSHGEDNRRVFR